MSGLQFLVGRPNHPNFLNILMFHTNSGNSLRCDTAMARATLERTTSLLKNERPRTDTATAAFVFKVISESKGDKSTMYSVCDKPLTYFFLSE